MKGDYKTLVHNMPQEKGIDKSIHLLVEGYHFIPNRCRRFKSDIFETRLMGEKVICMSGEEAAELFYDPEKFQRQGAAPKRIQQSLFGENGVQTLDGAVHRRRKEMFMSLMTPKHIQGLMDITKVQLQALLPAWEEKSKIILFNEMQEFLCRTACQWAGVPLNESEVRLRATDLGALVDAFGAVGPRFKRGKDARKRLEAWLRPIIRDVRQGVLDVPKQSALHVFATYKDHAGDYLQPQIAAVEIINILRPIVAIATYITFGALAFHQYPETKKKLEEDAENYSQMFVQEVRRFYPFGPFTGARVRENFTWNNFYFEQGTLVLIDIYGTNYSPRLWEQPKKFWPERFLDRKDSLFDFIPQGGGDYKHGHRCAGERVTIEIMKTTLEFLAKDIHYSVPQQDLTVSLRRMPTLPKSKFIISDMVRK